jgi:FkbM family methyltransferase
MTPTERLFTRREPHQAEYAALAAFRDSTGLFVDIGANIGQSIASLRLYAKAMRAVCFEPLPALEPAMQELLRLKQIDAYHKVALGREPGILSLVVPTVGDVPLTSRATLYAAKFGGEPYRESLRAVARRPGAMVSLETVEVPCATLDSFDLAPAVLKLDVEGHELAVLEGAARTVQRHRPCILLEPSRDRPALQARMASLGYRIHRWAEGALRPWDGGPADNVWCEPEGARFLDGFKR